MKRFIGIVCCSCACASALAERAERPGVQIVEARAYTTSTWDINFALLANDMGEAVPQNDEPTEPEAVQAPLPKPRLAAKHHAPESRGLFDFEAFTQAQYATFRSAGSVYFKGKAGYLWETEDEHPDNLTIFQMVNGLDAHGAVGIGAGYKLSNGERLEFDYTVNKKDEKMFSIGYKF